jgi:hypothetical protein
MRSPWGTAFMALEALYRPRRYFHAFSLAAWEKPAKVQNVSKTKKGGLHDATDRRTSAESLGLAMRACR